MIVAGDFNLRSSTLDQTGHYYEMMKMFPGLTDIFSDQHPNTGYGCIDHILVCKCKVHNRKVEFEGTNISDHYGLMAEFSF